MQGLQAGMFCNLVVQWLSRVSVSPWTAARQAPLSFAISQSLLKFMSTELVMLPRGDLILCCPLLFCLQSFSASGKNPAICNNMDESGGHYVK